MAGAIRRSTNARSRAPMVHRLVRCTIGLAAVLALVMLAAAPAATARERTYTLRYGPVEVPGYTSMAQNRLVRVPRRSGFVVAIHAQLVDRLGVVIPRERVMLHHAIFDKRISRYDVNCGKRRISEPFYGTAEEDEALHLPKGNGYPLSRRDRWRIRWMVMNHRPTKDTVYIQYRVVVETSEKLRPVRPLWMRVVDCRESIFNVPGVGGPGSIFAQTRTWIVPESGRIVAGGAHLHGGGRSLVLSEPGCGGRTLFTAEPLYGLASDPIYNTPLRLHEPSPVDVSGFRSAAGLPVVKGQQLQVSANYDNEFKHPGVMGTMHLYLALDPTVTVPCSPPPGDIEVIRGALSGRTEPPPP